MPPSHHRIATVAVFAGSIMNGGTVSLKRKSLSTISSPSQPSPKRVALNSPPPSTAVTATTATAIATVEGVPACISPVTSPSPAFSPSSKRVTHNSPPPSAVIAAGEDGPASTVPVTSPSPAFSPFSKRVSEKSPFATATDADAAAAPPLPFSRFTKMQQPNNNRTLRRTLSEPPIFNSFTDFCRYMNSQSPENSKNSSNSVKSTLRRSISDPTAADIILTPSPAPPSATPALTSETGHEETTRS